MNARGLAVAVGDAPIVAFSALGDNERFAGDMRQHGLLAFRGYSDHKAFGPADLRDLDEWRKASGGDWLVCTEKDFCKIKSFLPAEIPLLYARNEIRLHDDTIEQIIKHASEKGFL